MKGKVTWIDPSDRLCCRPSLLHVPIGVLAYSEAYDTQLNAVGMGMCLALKYKRHNTTFVPHPHIS